MKVYFLNPPYFPHFGRGMRWQDTGRAGTLYYPIWLAYAAAVTERKYIVRLVDAPAWGWGRKEVLADIGTSKPDLIVMDSSFPSLKNDIEVADDIKQNFTVKICLVGPPASQWADRILDQGLDFIARWEYDFTILKLTNTLDHDGDLVDIKGLSFREGLRNTHNPDREFTTSEDLDTIPFVSKIYQKYLDIHDYFLGSSLYPEVQIFTGRGCPYQCTFCSWPHTLMGRKYRIRSIPNVIEELIWIEQNLPEVKEVFLEDDTFTIDRNRVLDFCHSYKEAGLTKAWACNARVSLDYETMKAMKDANCRLVIVGYESGSDTILRNIKKGSTVEQNRQFAYNVRKADLLVHGDFIIGLPGETKETIEQTKRLIHELKPDILQVSVATPFPGTEFFEWCITQENLSTNEPTAYLDAQGHQKAVVSYPELLPEEITKSVDKILRDYYFSFHYPLIAARQILRKGGQAELQRIWHSVRMYLDYIVKRNLIYSQQQDKWG